MLTSLEKEPLSVSETVPASTRPLARIELDDTQSAMLLSITRQHCKLALEHGRTGTTPERRQKIMKEIQSLRSTRDEIISEWRRSANK